MYYYLSSVAAQVLRRVQSWLRVSFVGRWLAAEVLRGTRARRDARPGSMGGAWAGAPQPQATEAGALLAAVQRAARPLLHAAEELLSEELLMDGLAEGALSAARLARAGAALARPRDEARLIVALLGGGLVEREAARAALAGLRGEWEALAPARARALPRLRWGNQQAAAARESLHALLTSVKGLSVRGDDSLTSGWSVDRFTLPQFSLGHRLGLDAAADAALELLHEADEAGDEAAESAAQLFTPQVDSFYSLDGTKAAWERLDSLEHITPARCLDAYEETVRFASRRDVNLAYLARSLENFRFTRNLMVCTSTGIMPGDYDVKETGVAGILRYSTMLAAGLSPDDDEVPPWRQIV